MHGEPGSPGWIHAPSIFNFSVSSVWVTPWDGTSSTYQLSCELWVCPPVDGGNVDELSRIKQTLLLDQACRENRGTRENGNRGRALIQSGRKGTESHSRDIGHMKTLIGKDTSMTVSGCIVLSSGCRCHDGGNHIQQMTSAHNDRSPSSIALKRCSGIILLSALPSANQSAQDGRYTRE